MEYALLLGSKFLIQNKLLFSKKEEVKKINFLKKPAYYGKSYSVRSINGVPGHPTKHFNDNFVNTFKILTSYTVITCTVNVNLNHCIKCVCD